MAYSQGGLIEADDFNTFRTQVLNVYGVGNGDSGYGQTTVTVPTVTGGQVELVKSLEWTALRTAIETCANHQGTTVDLPPAAQLDVGAEIRAHTSSANDGDIPTAITDTDANKLVADAGSVSIFSNVLSSTRNTSWNTQVQHEFEVLFSTADEARYFFNSGGRIIIRVSRTGGSVTDQNSSWTSILNFVGSISMDANSTFSSTGFGTASGGGYYGLAVGSYAKQFEILQGDVGYSAYNANNYEIWAQSNDGPQGVNGDNGRRLRFRIDLNDVYAGGGDAVDGTLTSIIDLRRATTHLTIAAPSTSTLTELTAGS